MELGTKCAKICPRENVTGFDARKFSSEKISTFTVVCTSADKRGPEALHWVMGPLDFPAQGPHWPLNCFGKTEYMFCLIK